MNKILQVTNKNYSRTRDQSEMTLSLSCFFLSVHTDWWNFKT